MGDVSGLVSSSLYCELSTPPNPKDPKKFEVEFCVFFNVFVGDGIRTAEYFESITAAVGQYTDIALKG